MAENTTAVQAVIANDADLPGDPITYAIAGGVDQAFFNIDGSGNLSFNAAPDYETPADSDGNNDYVVDVSVFDGANSAVQTITVNVTDVAETSPPPPPPPSGGPGPTDGGPDPDGGGPAGNNPGPSDPPDPPDDVGNNVPPDVLPPYNGNPVDPVDSQPGPSEPNDGNVAIEEFVDPLNLDGTQVTSDNEGETPNPLSTPMVQDAVVKQLNKTTQSLRDSESILPSNLEELVVKLEDFAQAAPLLPPLELSSKLLDLIDVMKEEMSDADLSDEQFLILASAATTTLTLSVGYVAWLLRVGYLATSLLSLTPLLIREFDPLLVLAKKRKDKEQKNAGKRAQIQEKAPASNGLIDGNVYPKSQYGQPQELS